MTRRSGVVQRRLRRTAACLLALAQGSGCTPVVRPAARVGAADPAAVLAVVRAREDAIGSLRASFTVRTRAGERERAADGVLLVQKPDRFRLRLMLGLGVTVFDYLSVGRRAQLTLPLEGKVINGTPEGEWAVFSRDDLGQAFLRGARAFPGDCAAQEADATTVLVTCRGDGRVQRRLWIARDTATIREEVSYAGDAPQLTLRFTDYRMIGDVPMPFRIELRYPVRGVVVEIAVRTTEVNVPLAPASFEPLAPWGDAES